MESFTILMDIQTCASHAKIKIRQRHQSKKPKKILDDMPIWQRKYADWCIKQQMEGEQMKAVSKKQAMDAVRNIVVHRPDDYNIIETLKQFIDSVDSVDLADLKSNLQKRIHSLRVDLQHADISLDTNDDISSDAATSTSSGRN